MQENIKLREHRTVVSTVMYLVTRIITERNELCNAIKKNNHDTSGKRYYCAEKIGRWKKDCDKSYPTDQQLQQHIRGIHGEGFVAYCGKSFTWPLGRHRHQEKCTKCNRLMQE